MKERIKKYGLMGLYGVLFWLGISLITNGTTSGLAVACIYWVITFKQIRMGN